MTGAGMLVGNLLVGAVRGLVEEKFAPTFAVAAALTGVLLIAFAAGFRPEEETDSSSEDACDMEAISQPASSATEG